MDLYQLEYFLEAARQRSFTRAAEKLHLAQAALSEQMRKLELDLGAVLFHRSRRETTLTAAGEALRGHAEILITQAQTARRAVSDVEMLRGGRLVIGAIPSVSACVLPGVIAEFRRQYPAVELSLLEGTSESVAQWVELGRVDLGVVQMPAVGGRFEETELFAEPFVLLVSHGHGLAGRRRVLLAEVAGESFVFYRGRARDTAQAACRAAGFEPRIACESSELETIRSLVDSGLGIALLPELATRNAKGKCAVIRLSGEVPKRRVATLQKSGQPHSPSAAVFKSLLVNQTRKAHKKSGR